MVTHAKDGSEKNPKNPLPADVGEHRPFRSPTDYKHNVTPINTVVPIENEYMTGVVLHNLSFIKSRSALTQSNRYQKRLFLQKVQKMPLYSVPL